MSRARSRRKEAIRVGRRRVAAHVIARHALQRLARSGLRLALKEGEAARREQSATRIQAHARRRSQACSLERLRAEETRRAREHEALAQRERVRSDTLQRHDRALEKGAVLRPTGDGFKPVPLPGPPNSSRRKTGAQVQAALDAAGRKVSSRDRR